MFSAKTITGETFTDQMIDLDQNSYVDCRFVRCHLNYSGGTPRFDGCVFEHCRVRAVGAAGDVIEQLRGFWSIPGGGPSMVQELLAYLTGVPDAAERVLR